MKTTIEVNRVGNHYSVTICWLPESDGMFEYLTHAARFTDKAKAQRLADKVREAFRAKCREGFYCPTYAVNLDHWIWTPSQCSPIGELHKAPTATPYVI